MNSETKRRESLALYFHWEKNPFTVNESHQNNMHSDFEPYRSVY